MYSRGSAYSSGGGSYSYNSGMSHNYPPSSASYYGGGNNHNSNNNVNNHMSNTGYGNSQAYATAADAANHANDNNSQTSTRVLLANGAKFGACCCRTTTSTTQSLWASTKERFLSPVSHAFLSSSYWRVLLVFGNFILLFGSPIQMLLFPPALDPVMDVLYTLVLVAFLVDMIFRAVVVSGYFGVDLKMIRKSADGYHYMFAWPHMGSFLFWCDLFSTLTLLWDISFTNPRNFDIETFYVDLEANLALANGSLEKINNNNPWEFNWPLMITILKTARVVRFVRSQAVSNLISKVNWYYPMQRLTALCNYLNCCPNRRRFRELEEDHDDTVKNPKTTHMIHSGNHTHTNLMVSTKSTSSSGKQDRSNRISGSGNNNNNNNVLDAMDQAMNSSKTSHHTGAGGPEDHRRASWGAGIGVAIAIKAQRLANAEESPKTLGQKMKQWVANNLFGKSQREIQKQQLLAAAKIQRAWRRYRDRKTGLSSNNSGSPSDLFQDEQLLGHGLGLAAGGKSSVAEGGSGGGKWTSSLSKTISAKKKLVPKTLRKMSIYPGMDAAGAAASRVAQKLKYAAGGESAAESQVGGAMRELTGQRVAIGILVALLLTATFTYVEYDSTRSATMVILHAQTTGTSISRDGSTTVTRPPPASWIQTALAAARTSSIPDLYQFNASNLEGDDGIETFEFEVDENDDNDLRNREKLMVIIKSTNWTDPNNRTMTSVGWFAYQKERKNEALVQLMSTIFILLLWLFGVTAFAGPVMVLVVLPIERMVRLLGMLMVDPLGYQSTSQYRRFVREEDELTKNTRWTKEVLKGMETSFLMSTILRIGSLMKVGFGSAGVEIIRKNLEKRQGGSVNLQTSKGVTVSCIFLFCDIRQFTDATECLQEEVFVFTNRIAAVVHSNCHSFGGSANKNVGDAFLCSWLLDDPPNDGFDGDEELFARSNQADKCLMCVVRIIMALHHDNYYIETMSEAPRQRLLNKLKKRPGPVVQMGCGLHAGKAVQGAIGSERKIDATYVSEAVEMSEFLESSTKKYGLKMLMSNAFYKLMHSNNRQRCRLVDQIVMPSDEEDEDDLGAMYERDDIVELYTFDMDVDALWKAPAAAQKSTGAGVGGGTGASKQEMDGGSMSDADSRQGISDRRGELKKVLSAQRNPGSTTRLTRPGRRMSITTMLHSKSVVNSSNNSQGLKNANLDNSVHEALGGGGGAGATEHNSAAMKPPNSDPKEGAPEFRKPELILPTGPALYTPAMWRTNTMFRIRKKYLDGLFFHNYSTGLQSFYHREWDRATQSFKAILDSFEDGPSRYFLNQIEKNGGKPPPNFKPYGIA